MMNIRIGKGYDVHQLAKGEKLIIGGVEIPFEKGTVAHSDGDVLIHAICDALLGAAAMGDIGVHFPDNSDLYKNIDSMILLERTMLILRKEGYSIGNIDSTICLENPKLKDYIYEMRKRIATVLHSDISNISVKATTTEKLGFIGRGEGISAYAVALIFK